MRLCVRCALTARIHTLTALRQALTARFGTDYCAYGTDYCAYGTLIAGRRCADSSAAPLGHIAPCHAGVYAVVAADARRATALCERVALEHDFAHVSELTMPPVDLMVLQLATCDVKPATLFDATQHARHTQSGTVAAAQCAHQCSTHSRTRSVARSSCGHRPRHGSASLTSIAAGSVHSSLVHSVAQCHGALSGPVPPSAPVPVDRQPLDNGCSCG